MNVMINNKEYPVLTVKIKTEYGYVLSGAVIYHDTCAQRVRIRDALLKDTVGINKFLATRRQDDYTNYREAQILIRNHYLLSL